MNHLKILDTVIKHHSKTLISWIDQTHGKLAKDDTITIIYGQSACFLPFCTVQYLCCNIKEYYIMYIIYIQYMFFELIFPQVT